MEWKDSYSLGIAEIDNQHKGLLRKFTAIENAISSGKGWSVVHYAVVELRKQASAHFQFEEALLRLFGFPQPELMAHSKEHEYFFVKLDEIERHSLNDSAEQEMVGFLSSWLTKHILVTDRAYAGFILAGAQVVRAT